MDANVLQAIPNLVHKGVPLLLISMLLRLLNCVLVLVIVTIERVYGQRILEAHRESLVLIREPDEYIFSILFSELE